MKTNFSILPPNLNHRTVVLWIMGILSIIIFYFLFFFDPKHYAEKIKTNEKKLEVAEKKLDVAEKKLEVAEKKSESDDKIKQFDDYWTKLYDNMSVDQINYIFEKNNLS